MKVYFEDGLQNWLGELDRDDLEATEQPKTVDLGDMTGAPGFRDRDDLE